MAYSLSTALAIYFVLWWIVLFTTLPFGVRSQHEDGEGAPGTDPGAPVMTRMGYKLLWTRLISGVVFGIGMWAYYPGYLNTERLSKLMGLPFQGKVTMLRSVAPVFLLLTSISAPASAMDPSA